MENDKNKQAVIYIGVYPTLSMKINRIEVLRMKNFFVESLNGLENRFITAISCEIVDICGHKHYKFVVSDTETPHILCNSVQGVYELIEVK
jgi:hypothetical protein